MYAKKILGSFLFGIAPDDIILDVSDFDDSFISSILVSVGQIHVKSTFSLLDSIDIAILEFSLASLELILEFLVLAFGPGDLEMLRNNLSYSWLSSKKYIVLTWNLDSLKWPDCEGFLVEIDQVLKG